MFRRDIFSANHKSLMENVGAFLDTDVVPYHDHWAASKSIPREIWNKAGRAGLLCRTVPGEYGWVGASFVDSVVII